jgi:hypothetical protein
MLRAWTETNDGWGKHESRKGEESAEAGITANFMDREKVGACLEELADELERVAAVLEKEQTPAIQRRTLTASARTASLWPAGRCARASTRSSSHAGVDLFTTFDSL